VSGQFKMFLTSLLFISSSLQLRTADSRMTRMEKGNRANKTSKKKAHIIENFKL